MSLIKTVDEISSNPRNRKAWLALACVIFAVIIVIPAVYVIFSIPSNWSGIQDVLSDSAMMSIIWGAIWNSFSLAFIVTIIDIIVGLPMAWMLVRKSYRFGKYLDTLIDMPLAFPTVALGFSVIVFWGCPEGITVPGTGLVVDPYLMVILLHIIFTYPYMVRCLSGILEQIDTNYETAAMTLGASKWTAVRTITLPLFRAGLVTGFILCFARSLSETGGTYIVLRMMGATTLDVTGFFTGPTLISTIKDIPETDSMPVLILISSLLIVFALLMLFVAKAVMTRLRIPWRKVCRSSAGGSAAGRWPAPRTCWRSCSLLYSCCCRRSTYSSAWAPRARTPTTEGSWVLSAHRSWWPGPPRCSMSSSGSRWPCT